MKTTFIYSIALYLLNASLVYAVPGPDTVAVIANQNSDESVNLANYYRQTRQIMATHACQLDLPIQDDISLQTFKTQLYEPLVECLGEHIDHLEAIVMMRGMPLRVSIPVEGSMIPDTSISTSSLLTWAFTTTRSGESILDHPLIQTRACGSQYCWTAIYDNPWKMGSFYSQWTRFKDQLVWKMILVTRIDALDAADSMLLLQHAEESGVGTGESFTQSAVWLTRYTMLLMKGANIPRAALDFEFPIIMDQLIRLGVDVDIVDFDTNAQFNFPIASMIVGSESLLEVVENHQYMPGSLVDNLTSFAAHPDNFTRNLPEVQAALTRWIPHGATGLHGTVNEPLNDSFPSRWFLVDYAYGASLAEVFYRYIPYAFWQNVVLGDPMVAVYAQRPMIEMNIQEDSSTVINIIDPNDRDIEYVSLWYQDQLWHTTRQSSISICEVDPMEILVVAQVYGEAEYSVDGVEGWPAKGWSTLSIPACRSSVESDMMVDDMLVDDMLVDDMLVDDMLVDDMLVDDMLVDDMLLDESTTEDDTRTEDLETRSPQHTGCQQYKDHQAEVALFIFLVLLMMKSYRSLHTLKSKQVACILD